MIMKRAWTGKDGNANCPLAVHTMEGLSPFTMLDLNEDEVARLNHESDLLTSASMVRVDGLRNNRKNARSVSPPKRTSSR